MTAGDPDKGAPLMPDAYPAGRPPEEANRRRRRCQAADLTTAAHPQLAGWPRKGIHRKVPQPPDHLSKHILQRHATLPV